MHFNFYKTLIPNQATKIMIILTCVVLIVWLIIKWIYISKDKSTRYNELKKDLSTDNEKVKDLIRSENKDTQQNIEKAQKSLENNDNQIYSLLNKNMKI